MDTDVHDALLKAILANPAADLPRLVYADFIEESGNPDRAEFIRVGCEIAALNAAGHGMNGTTDHPPFPKRGPGAASMPTCSLCNHADDLTDRGHELFKANRDDWFGRPAESWGFIGDISIQDTDRIGFTVSRGFVDLVRCPLNWWVGWECRCRGMFAFVPCSQCGGRGGYVPLGRHLLSYQPVMKVYVTDKVPAETATGWRWGRNVGLDDTDTLPSDIFDRLDIDDSDCRYDSAGDMLTFPDRRAAVAALSTALICWAKEKYD